MNILISGASGFIGTALQKELPKKTHQLTTISRDMPLDNIAAIQYDCLIHLAGRAHVMHETETDAYKAYKEVNVDYSIMVAKTAKSLKIKRFIYISSAKVNGESSTHPFSEKAPPQPEDNYGLTKLQAEIELTAFCQSSGIELVIIRPPLIYGPNVKANFKSLIELCKYPIPLPLGNITNKRSLISLENLINFIELCCSHPLAKNETFLISDDHDVSTTELICTVRAALGRKPCLLPVPSSILKLAFNLIGKASLSERLLSNLQVDISKAKQMLGWKPAISFEEGIKRTVSEYVA